MPVVVERQAPMVLSVQKPVEMPQIQILDNCCCHARCVQTTGADGPDRAEAHEDSTVEDLGQGCSHARFCSTTGAHGLDRVGNCRDSTDADRIRATHVRHGTRLGSSASWCGVCPARSRCRVPGSSTHRDVVSGKESQAQCAIILRRHPFQIEVCERNVLGVFQVH